MTAARIGDLHVHSRFSDGSYSLEEAIAEAARRGLGALSFVDHDTTAGVDHAAAIGAWHGVGVVPGVEISAYDRSRNRKAHLLGYFFDRSRGNIETLCNPLARARHAMTLRQIDILSRVGYPVDVASVETAASAGLGEGERALWPGTLFKQHIMLVLIGRGLTDAIYGSLYRKLFKGNGICAFEIDYVDIFDALAAIKADGGVAVLAHPGQQDTWDLIEPLAGKGLDGIELYHPDHGRDDYERVMHYAHEHDLVMTGGSDDHGKFGSSHSMGDLRAPHGAVEALRERATVVAVEPEADDAVTVRNSAGRSPVASKPWDWSTMDAPEWNSVSSEFLPVALDWVAGGPVDVLDFGCGVGRHSLWLAERGARVTAVDLSAAGVDKLRRTATERGLDDRVTAVVADMVSIPLAPGSFDHAVAYHSIYHSDSVGLAAALRIVRHSLREGGEFYVTFLSKRSPAFAQPGDTQIDGLAYMRGSGSEIGIPHTFVEFEDIVGLMVGFRILKAQQIEDIDPTGTRRAWHYFIRAVAQ
jgi:phosphoribosyl 1,2-cyclic phosphate 1,2-diphosphodiesterase